jgi:polysaccharide deacetylase family protein (PEP-CTERM system associated)
MPGICNAMTVDVEDYFQVSALEPQLHRDRWEKIPTRVEANMDRILQLFSEKGVKATFFTLGWIAQRHPSIVRKIVAEGHELASHGWEHTRVTQQNQEQFREDVLRTHHLLEDMGGQQVKGYRAASYSICKDNLWALDVLADCGYRYSSSIVPIKHDLYGMPEAPRFAFMAANGRLLEIPITTIAVVGRQWNCGGGGWFRLYPYSLSRWALQQVNGQEKRSGIFYFHPWEIDPDQPRVAGVSVKTRFRHYINLGRMYDRVARLLDDFQWGRMDDIFLGTTGGGVRNAGT